jgi:hypothetical protein
VEKRSDTDFFSYLPAEPSSPPSGSHCRDTELTLENLELQVFTIHPAPVYIIAALG